jgi:hypothetical protein
VVVELTTDQKGAIAESAIVHAAIKLGVGVYKPLTDGHRYDLIFDVGSKLLRIQCKWANQCRGAVVVRCYSARRGPEGMIVRRYSAEEVDAIAAYCRETGCCYLIPPELFGGRRVVHLRVAASGNNQRMGINWAEAFALDAKLGALVGP